MQFKENHTDTKVSFLVEFEEDTTKLFGEDLMAGSFPKEFRLVNLLSETNMVLIKPETMAPHRYMSTNEIFMDFFESFLLGSFLLASFFVLLLLHKSSKNVLYVVDVHVPTGSSSIKIERWPTRCALPHVVNDRALLASC